MSEKQQQVSRTIDAPPEKVFALLADPGRHTEIDGAGHLKGLAEGGRLSGVGGTTVTHTYDWSGVGDESALVLYPRVTPEQMDGTVQRIADALGG